MLAEEAEAPSWHEPHVPPPPELLTLVLPQGWPSLLAAGPRRSLEERILPEYLLPRRWFAAKDEHIAGIELSELAELPAELDTAVFLTLSVRLKEERRSQLYALPLATTWEDAPEEKLTALRPYTLARVRRGPRPGIMHDAMADDDFVRGLVKRMRDNAEIAAIDGGWLVFSATDAFPADLDLDEVPVHRSAREQSNTSVQLGDEMVLKLYRQLHSGIHPELEMGRYLTEEVGFRNAPAMLGSLVHVDASETPVALALLMRFMPNQGDAWTFTLDYLRRFFEEADLLSPSGLGEIGERHEAFLARMETLGSRTGELHLALAAPSKDRAFAPKPIGRSDLARWRSQIRQQARMALAAVRRIERSLDGEDRALARRMLKSRSTIMAQIKAMTPEAVEAAKTRHHGDLHLGQVLMMEDDFLLIDFEGEPARSLPDRRIRHSPLRDVAGMLRSFDYAAAVALRSRAAIRPEAVPALVPVAQDWRQRTKTAFMKGYRQAAAGCPSFPSDEAVAERLINLFMLEKALYEVCYEAANRPDWVRAPVAGVLELIGSNA